MPKVSGSMVHRGKVSAMSKKLRKLFKQLRTPLSWALTLILVTQLFPAQGMAYALGEAAEAFANSADDAIVVEDNLADEETAIVEEAPVEETVVAEDEPAVVEEEPAAEEPAVEPEPAEEPSAEPEGEDEPVVAPEDASEEPATEPEGEETVEPEETYGARA